MIQGGVIYDRWIPGYSSRGCPIPDSSCEYRKFIQRSLPVSKVAWMIIHMNQPMNIPMTVPMNP